MEEEWDYLIVLDACRYDYFSKLYKNYLKGELKKVISLGHWTPDWCKESFKTMYNDVIYVSANPYINSKFEIKGFNAKKHFYKIIDVWDKGWNDKLGSVHPKEVNKAVKKVKDNYPSKRLIIHYLQPHEPYLCYNPEMGFPQPQLKFGRVLSGLQNIKKDNRFTFVRTLLSKFLTIIRLIVSIPLGKPRTFKIYLRSRKLINLPPINPMDAVQRTIGDRGLRELYIKNLKIVLEYVSELVKELNGTIIITSDHGELLGEDGYYCHGPETPRDNPLLMEIPWLKVIKKGFDI